ncbi:MAG: nitroreductase family protein [Nitrospirales bacterium]
MGKEAATRYPIHPLLQQRWSPRAFSDRMVEKDKLLSLLEAARWAPSSFNEQPWSFILATKDNRVDYERLLRCLVDGNIRWAQQAPLLMLSVAKLHFDHNGKPNRHAFHDVGLAAANLIIQASALGLYVHQMAGFHLDRAREAFQIPDSAEPVAAMAVGYLGDPQQLAEELRDKESTPRTRKPLSDFVFSGAWSRPSPLLNDQAH